MTGRPGITEQNLDVFLQQTEAYLEWVARGDLPAGGTPTDLMPLGEDTAAAYRALEGVTAKVEGFFARCRVVSFNPLAAARIGIEANDMQAADLTDPASIDGALARAPLAEPNAGGILPLGGGVNPIYREQLRELRVRAVEPLLGRGAPELTEEQWRRVKAALTPFGEWQKAKQGAAVEGLGREKLRRYLEGPYTGDVRDLLAKDREVAVRLEDARELKKLLLYHKYLLLLANNFVSFPDLYDPRRRAMFEKGSLVIDGRWFHFAVEVDDLQEHAKLAKTSRMCVIYAELVGVDETDRTLIATPATSGTQGNLCVGRRGVFYDTDGRHYDARVVQIIENPISFREALVSPFVRLVRFIGGKIEAISGSAQKELEAKLGQVTDRVQSGVREAVREAPTVAEQALQSQHTSEQARAHASASRRDLLLGASVSIAALSSAFAFITKSLAGVSMLTILLALLVVVAVVFLPTALLAAAKLRQRDLSAILEGCGWAINARMRLNRRQRRQFTRRESYPEDATGMPRTRWALCLLVAAVLCVLLILLFFSQRSWRTGQESSRAVPVRVEEAEAPDSAPAPSLVPTEEPRPGGHEVAP
ncbi:MAG: hypothetical protein ACYS1C_11780 [Planctomycetota bacterium]|jgi:hypothetical protein